MSFGTPQTTASTGFSFNLPTASSTAAQTPTFGSLGGGDAGGLKPLGAAPTGGLFGATAASTAATTAAAAPTLSFGAGLGTSTAASQPSTLPTLSLGGQTAQKTLTLGQPQANLTTVTKTSDSSVAALPATQVTYNQLEEHINKWTLELEEQEKVFTDQATQINAWDKLLINNNQQIVELNKAVQKVKSDQQTLEQELEFIATQHTELEESIAPLQKEFQKLPQVDIERSQVYLLVENLDTQLKQMSDDLKEIIDNLNEANKGQDNTDPIIQIGKILNAHMSSLQWIESTSSGISSNLDDLTKMHESFKRDSERSFRSAYYN